MWTGDISNMFDEISHAEILIAVTWALNSVAECSGNRIVDQFSVARFGKGVRIGVDYTNAEMVMITASQQFDICKFNMMHSYVNVRHQRYKYATRGDWELRWEACSVLSMLYSCAAGEKLWHSNLGLLRSPYQV